MPQTRSQIARQSVRFKPISNTEVNVERLPHPKSLQTTELCHREQPVLEPGWQARTVLWLTAGAVVGSLFASGCLAAPQVALQGWTAMSTVEGLPVVGAMVLGMFALIALLSLVFIPTQARNGLFVLVAPPVASAFSAWTGYEKIALGALFVASTVGACVWYRSVVGFHNEWLRADPQVDRKVYRNFCTGAVWKFPSVEEIGGVLHRYLNYDAPRSGAAGVWIAPSAQSSRIGLMAIFVGSLLAFSALVVAAAWVSAGSHLVGACTGSLLMLCAVTSWTTGKTVAMTAVQEHLLSSETRTFWEQNAERIAESQHVSIDPISKTPVCESDHLFLGFEPWQNFPVLIHRNILEEHAYFVGRTGSGKTSMGMMQHLIRLIRGHSQPARGAWSEKTPIVIIDLKGDRVLFQTAKAEAEKRGQKFRFFTLEPGKATFRFNPFSGFRSSTITIPQMVQLCLDALNLNHGVGYGRGYYSQRSRFFLSEALKATPNANSFRELYDTLRKLYGAKQDYRDAFELLSVVDSLTHYTELVTTKQDDNDPNADTIRIERVLEENEVVYFWLPAAKESAAVSTIGKLVLFNLQTAAQDREQEHKEKRQTYLLIDEFQKLAGENFQQILQQARSLGVAVALANQSLGDLKTEDWDLGPTIKTNTNLKLFFSLNDPEELKTMAELSGEELQTYGQEDSESIRARLSVQELQAISDHPKRLMAQISGGKGFTQFGGLPIPVETDWPISLKLAEERQTLPWPATPLRQAAVKPTAAQVSAPKKAAASPQPKASQQPKVVTPAAAAQSSSVPKKPAASTQAATVTTSTINSTPKTPPPVASASNAPAAKKPMAPGQAATVPPSTPQKTIKVSPATSPSTPPTTASSVQPPTKGQPVKPQAKVAARGKKSAKSQPAPKASPSTTVPNPNYAKTIQNLMEE
jgi:hypothetical protein